MNILYIAPYSGIDKWSLAAYNYLGILKSIPDINLVVRNFHYNSLQRKVDEWCLKLEENECCEEYDFIFQFCLPHDFVYTPNSIGITIIEPLILDDYLWETKLKLIPKVIVSTPQEKRAIKHNKNVVVEPLKIDSSIKYNIYKEPKINDLSSNYTFYWIGEYGDTACWKEVYKAYLIEFNKEENVHLLLHFINNPTQQLGEKLQAEFKEIKSSLNKYYNPQYYCKETINIGTNIDDIRSYHAYLDCYIDINKGVNNKSIIKEAQLFDKQIIINCIEKLEPIIGHPVYSAKNLWRSINIRDIQKLMRSAYLRRMPDQVNTAKLDFSCGANAFLEIMNCVKNGKE